MNIINFVKEHWILGLLFWCALPTLIYWYWLRDGAPPKPADQRTLGDVTCTAGEIILAVLTFLFGWIALILIIAVIYYQLFNSDDDEDEDWPLKKQTDNVNTEQ